MIQNQLVRESASGNFQNVKDILNKFPHVIYIRLNLIYTKQIF